MSLTRTFLPASGALSVGDTAGSDRSISVRFGGDVPHSLSEYYNQGTNTANNETIPASGALSFSDFYNKTELITVDTQTTGPEFNTTRSTSAVTSGIGSLIVIFR